MEFETKCLETLDKIMAEIEELSSMSPEDDAEAEAITGMIDSRKNWFAVVCDAYVTHKTSDLAKEVLRVYTSYKVEQESHKMKHIVINKDVFDSRCYHAIKNLSDVFKESNYTDNDLYWYSQAISDELQKYKGHRAPVDGRIVDLVKKYSKRNWVGTELVDLKLIEDSIEFIERQQGRLYDILKKYERGIELTTAEYITLQECRPFWGYAT